MDILHPYAKLRSLLETEAVPHMQLSVFVEGQAEALPLLLTSGPLPQSITDNLPQTTLDMVAKPLYLHREDKGEVVLSTSSSFSQDISLPARRFGLQHLTARTIATPDSSAFAGATATVTATSPAAAHVDMKDLFAQVPVPGLPPLPQLPTPEQYTPAIGLRSNAAEVEACFARMRSLKTWITSAEVQAFSSALLRRYGRMRWTYYETKKSGNTFIGWPPGGMMASAAELGATLPRFEGVVMASSTPHGPGERLDLPTMRAHPTHRVISAATLNIATVRYVIFTVLGPAPDVMYTDGLLPRFLDGAPNQAAAELVTPHVVYGYVRAPLDIEAQWMTEHDFTVVEPVWATALAPFMDACVEVTSSIDSNELTWGAAGRTFATKWNILASPHPMTSFAARGPSASPFALAQPQWALEPGVAELAFTADSVAMRIPTLAVLEGLKGAHAARVRSMPASTHAAALTDIENAIADPILSTAQYLTVRHNKGWGTSAAKVEEAFLTCRVLRKVFPALDILGSPSPLGGTWKQVQNRLSDLSKKGGLAGYSVLELADGGFVDTDEIEFIPRSLLAYATTQRSTVAFTTTGEVILRFAAGEQPVQWIRSWSVATPDMRAALLDELAALLAGGCTLVDVPDDLPEAARRIRSGNVYYTVASSAMFQAWAIIPETLNTADRRQLLRDEIHALGPLGVLVDYSHPAIAKPQGWAPSRAPSPRECLQIIADGGERSFTPCWLTGAQAIMGSKIQVVMTSELEQDVAQQPVDPDPLYDNSPLDF